MFYEGASIYSHGHHWVLARFTSHRGRRAVLLQVDSLSRSVSTAAHYREVRDAVDGLPNVRAFEVPNVEPHCPADHTRNARRLLARAVEQALKATRARRDYTRGAHADAALRLQREAVEYARFFGVLSTLGRRARADLQDLVAEARAARGAWLKSERAKASARRREQSEAFEEWRAGTRADCPYSYHVDEKGSAYLAVHGAEVVTSRGARVPIEHARRALAFVRSVWTRGEQWRRNGETLRVGPFQVDSIGADEVRAGCHTFTRERIEELARALDEAPAVQEVGS